MMADQVELNLLIAFPKMGFSMTIYMDFRRNYGLLTIYIYNNLIKVITRTTIILYIMVYELTS
jgi:hypothetical protein